MIVARIRPARTWGVGLGDLNRMRRDMAGLADAVTRGVLPDSGAHVPRGQRHQINGR